MSVVDDAMRALNEAISNKRRRIGELEAELRTLKSFKGDVIKSHDDFGTIVNTKKQYISNLTAEVSDNQCVTTLAEGMDETLNYFGVNYCKNAFTKLIGAVELKIIWYEAEILVEKNSLLGLLAQLG